MNDIRKRVIIERVKPSVDNGMFPIKRIVGDKVIVKADIFADGHDALSAILMYRKADESAWHEKPMVFLNNDRWKAEFVIEELTGYCYTVQAWVDHFLTWRQDFEKKKADGQDVSIDIAAGIILIEETISRATGKDAILIHEYVESIKKEKNIEKQWAIIMDNKFLKLITAYPDKTYAVTHDTVYRVRVDRKKALFSTWYEIFPRSCSSTPGKHGTLQDCANMIPYIAAMGFDVLYLPPVHPIGETKRKGKNNAEEAGPDDPGSPWAIGSKNGGFTAIEPKLGTMKDFTALVQKAQQYGMEIALDLAFQCSPDHPYINEKPSWFRKRPDGTMQYAENPPKKYEDIVPFNFESNDWKSLCEELNDVVLFWIDKGVQIFRVDNPHTKPFLFWEWLIAEIKKEHPDIIFLSEAFTRPKVMYRLAKEGFDQSYTYFTWRNTKEELTQYLTELTHTGVREFFRPHFWPNTPDILTEYLQFGGRPAFVIRLVLAATMSSNYGIYGPAYELCVNQAAHGKEEYDHAEKYELKQWERNKADSLTEFITCINRIRKENTALQTTENIRFFPVDNDHLLCYAKISGDGKNTILVVVNIDPFHTQSGIITVPIQDLGIEPNKSYMVYDLISHDRYIWQGERNFVQLDPHVLPVHILRLHSRLKRESDFDYYYI